MCNVGGTGQTGENTFEENLELARRRIEAAEANPASGSGTPYLDAVAYCVGECRKYKAPKAFPNWKVCYRTKKM